LEEVLLCFAKENYFAPKVSCFVVQSTCNAKFWKWRKGIQSRAIRPRNGGMRRKRAFSKDMVYKIFELHKRP
jgi:hypothetical protein